MSKTHWKKLHNPNFFGCYCFEDGKDIILTVKMVVKEIVKDDKGRDSECMVIHFMEDAKPFICNKTNAKTITKLYKTPFIEDWNGHKIQFYADKNVRMGKDIVEGVRIRVFIPKSVIPDKDKPCMCDDCKVEITGYGEMTALQIAQRNNQKYGKTICIECAKKLNEIGKVADVLNENN